MSCGVYPFWEPTCKSGRSAGLWKKTMEKLFEATIKDAETNEVLIKVSSYSQEGLEEEMGKTKWTKFASLVKPEFLMTEEELKNAEDELEWSHKDEMKREENL